MKTHTQDKSWIVTFNSVVYFLLAYYSVILLTNIFSLILAKIYGFKGVLYYFGFTLNINDDQWTDDLVFLIFFFGIAFSLLIGIICERIYRRIRKSTSHDKMFFFWAYFISFTYFFGNVIVGVVYYFGIGAVFTYYSVPLIIKIFLGAIAFFALIMIGRHSVRNTILSFNSYYHEVREPDLLKYLNIQILYPALIGNVIIFLVKIPHHAEFSFYDTYIFLCIFIIILTIYAARNYGLPMKFKRADDSFSLQKTPLILVILIIILIRVVFVFGI